MENSGSARPAWAWAFVAPLLVVVRPRTTTARVLRMSRPQVVVMGVWALWLLLWAASAWAAVGAVATQEYSGPFEVHERGFWEHFRANSVFRLTAVTPLRRAIAVWGGGIVGVLIGYVALAGLAMPWAAADEPTGRTFWRSLRVLATLPLLWGIPGLAFEFTHLWYVRAEMSLLLARVEAQCGPQPEWDRAQGGAMPWELHQWQLCAARVRGPGPSRWFLTGKYMAAALQSLGLILALLIWLRALQTPPPTSTGQERADRCRQCGYDLRFLDMEGRCPECGVPIAESLGPGVRVAPEWETATTALLPSAWLATTLAVLRERGRFFARMPAWSGQARARSYVLVNSAFASLLAFLGFEAVLLLSWGLMTKRERLPLSDLQPILALAVAVFFVGVVLPWVGVVAVGLAFRRRERLNLLAPLCKVACYLSAWLPPTIGVMIIPIAGASFLSGVGGLVIFTIFIIAIFAIPAIPAIALLWWLIQFAGGCRRVRYANR